MAEEPAGDAYSLAADSLTKKVLLVEHDYHVDELVRRGIAKDCEWVALGPSAMHRLDSSQIPYSIPEDYASSHEIGQACLGSYDRLKRVCEEIDGEIIDEDPFLAKWGIRPLFLHLWQLAMVTDALVARSVWLRVILDHFSSAEVYAFLNSAQPYGPLDISFAKTETLWGRLLSVSGWKNGTVLLPEADLGLENDGDAPQESYLSALKNRVKSKLAADVTLRTVASSIKYNIPWNIPRNLLPSKAGAILVLGHPYEWRHIFPFLCESGGKLIFIDSRHFERDLPTVQAGPWSSRTEELWAMFQAGLGADSNDYASALKDRVCWIIEKGPKMARTVMDGMERVLLVKSSIFKLLIHCGSTYFPEHVIRQIFAKRGVPAFGWQHGAVWYDKGITQKMDLMDLPSSTSFFTYGANVTLAYESSDLSGSCKIRSLGNITLDEISRNEGLASEQPCSILYVITNYYRNAWYCGFSPPFSDRIYFREQRLIIDALKEMAANNPQVKITIKLHPGVSYDSDPPWVTELKNVESIRLKRSPGFVGMLKTHDIIIIDTPTTTLLESIATYKPVFVLTSVITPPKSDLPLLKRRAVCAENALELMKKVDACVRERYYQADVSDRAYLRLYGTYLDDGKSCQRIKEKVGEVIRGFPHNRT
jgi:hypothetical protein